MQAVPTDDRDAPAGDRLLRIAADAVAGAPAAGLARAARAVLSEPGSRESLSACTDPADAALARLAGVPERLDRERLPLRTAVALALRSPRARAALRRRLAAARRA
jgi:hypothetical protein